MKRIANKFFLDLIDAAIPQDNEFYQDMFEVGIYEAPVSMFVLKEDAFSFANRLFFQMTGYSETEVQSGEIAFAELVHPDDLAEVRTRMLRRIEDKQTYDRYRIRFFKKNKELLYVEVHAKKVVRNGKMYLVGAVIDVTAEVEATAQLDDHEQRFKSLFDHNPDAVFAFDMEGNFTDLNVGCERLTGYSAAELLDSSFMPLIVEKDLSATLENFHSAAAGHAVNYEISIVRKDGKLRDLEVSNFPMKLKGDIVGAYGIAKDITERNEHKRFMESLVYIDTLTGLPNRLLFEDRLKQVYEMVKGHKDRFAVLFLGLDRFKSINDSYGHTMGDALLQSVALRLQGALCERDTVARFAGDEFAILVPDANEDEMCRLAASLNQATSEPFNVHDRSLFVSCSLGVAFSCGEEAEAGEVLKKAEAAMYYTKKYGKNKYTVYSDELDQQAAYKLMIEKDLKEAVQKEEFQQHYQPIMDLQTGKISAVEALIRWNHPTFGFVSPDDFIPISEQSGQIVAIGKWVLQTACTQGKAWQEKGYPPFRICVNISTIQLQHPGFIDSVKKILEETGLGAEWLELEVTESILMEDTKIMTYSLSELKSMGISISIDDFGTGYTSLGYLQQYSFDRVKIDRSFVQDINQERKGKAITSTIISLAHQLHMSVIAEGIEDKQQLAYLIEQNCDEGQGYLFSRPLSAADLELSLSTKIFG